MDHSTPDSAKLVTGKWAELVPGELYRPPRKKPQPVVAAPEPGRNEPCHCGSGRKYKKCCLGREL